MPNDHPIWKVAGGVIGTVAALVVVATLAYTIGRDSLTSKNEFLNETIDNLLERECTSDAVEEMTDFLAGTAWRVGAKPGEYHSEPWQFYANGEVEAEGPLER